MKFNKILRLENTKIYSGDFLMKIGFNPVVNSYRTSVVVQLNEVKGYYMF